MKPCCSAVSMRRRRERPRGARPWATCFWTICVVRVAFTDAGMGFQPSKSENLLANDLYRFTRLLPEQALGTVVRDVFEGMNRRYGERLGVSADALEREHGTLVDAARTAVSASKPPEHGTATLSKLGATRTAESSQRV
jgi:hypothetical protein